MTRYPYPSPHELSRGKRLLTGCLIGMSVGVAVGYALGVTYRPDAATWPARFVCRDTGSMEPARVRLCTLEGKP